MRSPRRMCSSGSSHTAHSVPTKVRSRRVRLRSISNTPAIFLEERAGGRSCRYTGPAVLTGVERERTDAEEGVGIGESVERREERL